MRKNQGYTLIEMIIVIAIIAILSGVSAITIGIIKKAKYNTAATTLDDQIGSLLIKTKAISEAKTDPLCMKIQYNAADVTYADGTLAKKGTYSLILGYHKGTSFEPKTANTAEATLPNIISIKYTKETGTSDCNIVGLDNNNMVIEFNKSNGSVRYGAGTYDIIYGDATVATIKLDAATGNHFVK